MDKIRLYKSSTDKKLYGVCGGLGDFFGIDSAIFRVIFLIMMFGFGVGFLPYIIMALILPNDYEVRGRGNTVNSGRQNPFVYVNQKERYKGAKVVNADAEDDWSDF